LRVLRVDCWLIRTTFFISVAVTIFDLLTPDIIVTPNAGVIYTGSKRKLSEHGGFSHDDTNVIMLLSNPSLHAKTVTDPVETRLLRPSLRL